MTATDEKDYEAEMAKMRNDESAEKDNKTVKKQKFGMPIAMLFMLGWSVITTLTLMVIGWNYLQSSVYESGVQSGAQNAAAQIYTDMINKAANDKCNTIFVQYDNRRVDLVNVRCLQALAQQDANAAGVNPGQSDATASQQDQ